MAFVYEAAVNAVLRHELIVRALADDGIVALRQGGNEVVAPGLLRRGDHIFYACIGLAKADVIGDGIGEKTGALENDTIKYEAYFKLIIATGMRRGECCGLRWSDIDYDDRSIHIQRNVVKLTGEEIFVKEPKTKSSVRYVYFSAEMESLLKDYRGFCEEVAAHEEYQLTDDDYLFRRAGTDLPMTPTTFTWHFKRLLRKSDLPDKLNVHSLRHTNASLLIAGGADVVTVAGLLGHAQPSTTLDIYSHAFDRRKREVSQILHEGLEI